LDESLFATATRPLSHRHWPSQLFFSAAATSKLYFGIPHAKILFLRTESENNVWFPSTQ